jgi:hypothetical protein
MRRLLVGVFGLICGCRPPVPPMPSLVARFPSDGPVEMLGDPQAWAGRLGEVPQGYRLWVGALWRNRSAHPLAVAVEYREYLPDGTAGRGCSGGEEIILPHEIAWLVCAPTTASIRTPLPKTVTARLAHAYVAPDTVAGVVVDSIVWHDGLAERLHHQHDFPSPVVYARASHGDINVRASIRLYDERGIQLGTCFVWGGTLQREAAQRLTALGCPERDALRGRVSVVSASFYRE